MLGIYWGDKYSSLIKFRRSEKGTKFKKSSTFNLTLLSIDWWIGNCVHILFSVSTVQTFKAKKSKQNCLLFIPFKVSFLKGKSNGNCWIWNQDIQIVHRPASLSYPVPGWGTQNKGKECYQIYQYHYQKAVKTGTFLQCLVTYYGEFHLW